MRSFRVSPQSSRLLCAVYSQPSYQKSKQQTANSKQPDREAVIFTDGGLLGCLLGVLFGCLLGAFSQSRCDAGSGCLLFAAAVCCCCLLGAFSQSRCDAGSGCLLFAVCCLLFAVCCLLLAVSKHSGHDSHTV
jgi:hypothetical protein